MYFVIVDKNIIDHKRECMSISIFVSKWELYAVKNISMHLLHLYALYLCEVENQYISMDLAHFFNKISEKNVTKFYQLRRS